MPLDAFEAALLAAAILVYLLAFGSAAVELAAKRRHRDPGKRLGRAFLLLALGIHGALLGARAWRLGDGAFADAPSLLVFVTWCGTLVASIIDLAQDLRALPVFLVPPVTSALALGSALLGEHGRQGAIPEAGRLLVRLHVAAAIVAYGAIGFAALLGVMYLFLEGQLRRKRIGVFFELPSLDRLEQAAGRFFASGFALLTVSLLLGVVAQAASGALGEGWLGRPKTLATLAAWVACGSLVVLSRRTLLAGRRQAVATLVVSGLVLLAYLGTPLLAGGEHVPASVVKSG